MYHSSKIGSIRIVAFLFVCALMLASLSMVLPKTVSANAGPFVVDGTVRDSAGRPIPGASVVVVMKNGATTIDTQSYTTDSNGFYTVDVGHDMWNPGFTVTSTATYNSVQASQTATVGVDPFLTIDLSFPFEIPQFGSLIGFIGATALVGIVAVVFLVRKPK